MTVLFLCRQNAGRSQMAQAFFERLAPADHVGVSGGSAPAAAVHPGVVQVMREVGIDLSAARPQRLTVELAQTAGLLVTMGCGESCPFIPGLERLDWPIADPKGQPTERVREIRNEIRARVRHLVGSRSWSRR